MKQDIIAVVGLGYVGLPLADTGLNIFKGSRIKRIEKYIDAIRKLI